MIVNQISEMPGGNAFDKDARSLKLIQDQPSENTTDNISMDDQNHANNMASGKMHLNIMIAAFAMIKKVWLAIWTLTKNIAVFIWAALRFIWLALEFIALLIKFLLTQKHWTN